MKNFWTEINKPIFALAPMEDVTDTAFREIVIRNSRPGWLNVVFAEFTSTDGMCHEIGRDRVSHRLIVSNTERALLKEYGIKIVAQIWGGKPENFNKTAKMICENYDFDGIDINMGCPVKKIVKQAACSQLIMFPELAKEIVLATKEASDIPVSVKTRTGIKEHITEQWVGEVLSTKPAAFILHCRTQKMMSDYPAEWEEIEKAVRVRNDLAPDIPLIGNGDIFDIDDAFEKIERYKIDGVMIGRGIFKDPWIFRKEKHVPTPEEKMNLLKQHAELFEKAWAGTKPFAILRKFFKIYAHDFKNASEIRAKLMLTNSMDEVRQILEYYGF